MTTCPFHKEEGVCGKRLKPFDKDGLTMVCPEGHRCSAQHLPTEPGEEPRAARKLSVQNAALLALLADAFVRHL